MVTATNTPERGGTKKETGRLRSLLGRGLPFLDWFRDYRLIELRADFVSGLTVALVLIPQSMAYAQLADLPPYFGLYAAFLPPLVAALFGSSHQLATGPVAIVSLMTSAALAPLAIAGSGSFIAYAVLLALLVGVFQFLLGALRLGMVVNFLSHPVVNGFTNAAALIIATSQLPKFFGVDVDKAEHHYQTVYRTVVVAARHVHWPTLGLGVLALLIMMGLKKLGPRVPGVLIAVVVTTIGAWATGFERNLTVDLDRIQSPQVHRLVADYRVMLDEIAKTMREKVSLSSEARRAETVHGAHSFEAIELHAKLARCDIRTDKLREEASELRAALRDVRLAGLPGDDGVVRFCVPGTLPPGREPSSESWRLRVGNRPIDPRAVDVAGGGEVVGTIPSGLPRFAAPRLDLSVIGHLSTMAVIISLLGFMEAISIAKAMAARTGQRLDPNRELIGQGLANIVGSFAQSYPVSGSFSRSAVNLQAGAVTGLSSAFSSLVVLAVLLFFTPLLYHLPQSVLAAIIMMAVIGLLNVSGFVHAWQVQKTDGLISVITFVATLGFAPHLDRGIAIGVVLSLAVYLYRNMKPRIAVLSKTSRGDFRDAERWGLETCRHVAVIRFNSSLFFANVNYLEDSVLGRVSSMPDLKHVLIVGNGMNELDASGEVLLSQLVSRLRERGIDISFTGLNDEVLQVMRRTHLLEKIGEGHFFNSVSHAVSEIHKGVCLHSAEHVCPLLQPKFEGLPVDAAIIARFINEGMPSQESDE